MRGKAFASSNNVGVAPRSIALAGGRLHWACCLRNVSAVFADSSMPIADNYGCSVPFVWNDQVGPCSDAIRLRVFSSLSAVWCFSVHWGTRDSRDVGVAENSSSEHRESSRCAAARTFRSVVDLEHRVQPDIRVIQVRSGKRQTPRRTGAFAKRKFCYQAATAPCASHSSLAAFCT